MLCDFDEVSIDTDRLKSALPYIVLLIKELTFSPMTSAVCDCNSEYFERTSP